MIYYYAITSVVLISPSLAQLSAGDRLATATHQDPLNAANVIEETAS
jgi:hypothetical protein